MLPSASVGVGVVARQLGSRDADAALRLRASIGWPILGVVVGMDYWPALGSWTATFSARISF